MIEIRGRAEVLTIDDPPSGTPLFGPDAIRIRPRRVHSWHIDPAVPGGHARTVPDESATSGPI